MDSDGSNSKNDKASGDTCNNPSNVRRDIHIQEPYTVFPPCVVHSIHEVIPYLASSETNTGTMTVARDDTDRTVASTCVKEKKNRNNNCLSKCSGAITWGLEAGFFQVGLFVGRYPVLTIIVMLIMCGLCGLGMKTFHETEEQEKLWVPQSSRTIPEKAWVDRTFPEETRFVSMLAIEPNGNILKPPSINALMDYYVYSKTVEGNGKKLKDMCVRAGPFCYVSSLLELWGFNETRIRSLTEADIIQAVNQTVVSPVSGVDVVTLLGGDLTYSKEGKIIGAQATQITWVLRKGNGDNAAAWEKKMIDLALKGSPNITRTYVYASRSFDDEGYGAINSDTQLLAAGFSIVFIYILFSLGRFNLLEQKIYLSLSGMACVGLSILVSYGVATAIGTIFSPIQTILPFLLLGIGVDDMFVIIETWKNLSPEEERLEVPNKLAMTLSRAGVSITVTSVTDIVAFGIGSTTVIPALQSFCIYAALGIFALYVIVSTIFVAVLALDDRRRKARRDACICCYRHSENYTPNKCSTGKTLLQILFGDIWGPFITKLPVQIFIIVIAVVMAGLGLWRFIKMPQEFDIVKYLPQDSYAYDYSRTKENYFDREGFQTSVYCGGFDYFKEQNHLETLHDKISNNGYIQQGTVDSWFTAFKAFLQGSGTSIANKEDYYHELYTFLNSVMGQRFARFVKFNSTFEPVSVVASYINMRHYRQETSSRRVDSMDSVRATIDSVGFPKFEGDGLPEYMCFAYCRDYLSLETNKVLQEELYRNLGLAAAAVLAVTLVLIANVKTSLLVFLCVLFTVVDVGGVLELWGTTIDTASSILLTLAVGLAVDFSAHIGHTFMTISGSRKNRVIMTLRTIGPAVFNGGLSTFLAFVLLADSASYGFQLFFRVFLSVVVFGLFHGLALLPVLLSFLGPEAYQHADEIPDEINMDLKADTGENGELPNMGKSAKYMKNEEHPKNHYTGPIYTVFKDPDDLWEQRNHGRLPNYFQPLPATARGASKGRFVSVIDVTGMPSTRSLTERTQQQHEGVTKL